MGQRKAHLCQLIALTVPMLMLVWWYSDFVPLWDGSLYSECVLRMAASGFSEYHSRCGYGDPVISYMAALALAYILGAGKMVSLFVCNLLLWVLALCALNQIMRALVPSASSSTERVLVLALFGYCPTLVPYVFNIAPDFAVMVFFLMVVVALLDERPIRAAFFGLALVFSKSTGVALYAATIGLYLAIYPPRRPILSLAF